MNTEKSLKLLTVILLFLFQPVNITINAQTDSLYYLDSIRVSAPDFIGGELTGRLLNIKNDTLKIIYATKTFGIPLRKIKSLEAIVGEKSNTWSGALYGGIAGGVLVGILAAANNDNEEGGIISFTPTQAFTMGFFSGALVGSLVGLVVGSQTTSSGWEDFNTDSLIYIPKLRKFWEQKKYGAEKTLDTTTTEIPTGKPETQETKNLLRKLIYEKKNKWHFDLVLGSSSGGPAENIETAMNRDGWGDSEPVYGLFSVSRYKTRPVSNASGLAWTLQGTYRVSKHFDFGIIAGNTPLGETIGYNSNIKKQMTIESSAFILSPVVHLLLTESFRIGLGPLISFNDISQSVTSFKRKTQFGGIIQLNIIYPPNATFFVKLDVQHRILQKYKVEGLRELDRGLNPFDVNFTNTFIGLGLGISF